jgi:hypothetical protein
MSRVVNWMINTKPIFEVMKFGAKNAMKSTTLKAGIDWDGHVREMQQKAEVKAGPAGDSCTSKHKAAVQLVYSSTDGFTSCAN